MRKKISALIIKQLQETITAREQEELEQYAAKSETNRQFVSDFTNYETLLNEVRDSYKWFREDDLARIKKGLSTWGDVWRYSAVAAAVLLLLFGLWYYSPGKKKTNLLIVDVPATSFDSSLKALLKTSSGAVMNLDLFYNGPLMNTLLTKSDSQLIYPVNYMTAKPGIDTLETPKGSLYSLRLPDSSTVWLNCASILRYPNSFTGPERVVYLDGEAYFEIAENRSMPFKVVASGIEIRVTGTKFNVKAYKNERTVRTTLLEGSLKIRARQKTESLKPGEQAVITNNGKLKKINADSTRASALAWKSNQFDWNHTPLETIVEDICNWYGLKSVYKVNVHSFPYSATLNRSRPLNEILTLMELNMPYKFKQEGNNLLILQAD
jgi:transmembrane sensor